MPLVFHKGSCIRGSNKEILMLRIIEDDKKNEIDEILKEYDEDDFNKFEELDDDLY